MIGCARSRLRIFWAPHFFLLVVNHLNHTTKATKEMPSQYQVDVRVHARLGQDPPRRGDYDAGGSSVVANQDLPTPAPKPVGRPRGRASKKRTCAGLQLELCSGCAAKRKCQRSAAVFAGAIQPGARCDTAPRPSVFCSLPPSSHCPSYVLPFVPPYPPYRSAGWRPPFETGAAASGVVPARRGPQTFGVGHSRRKVPVSACRCPFRGGHTKFSRRCSGACG